MTELPMTGLPELLEIDGLVVTLPVNGEHRAVLRGVDFTLSKGEAIGLVGESGSGKSMTVRAIDMLLPPGARVQGTIRFDGTDIASLRGRALAAFRNDVAMIFQDPRAHINPVRRIGDFMTEAATSVSGASRRDALTQATEMLDAVRVTNPAERLRQYPHELSGGMLQRVMIATALMGSPRLLLADEPTTALDVTIQAEVMGIIDELRRERGMAMIFISHDLELAAAVCDRTAVMYAGQIVEMNGSRVIEEAPLHPYSAALLRARPRIDATVERLDAIPGQPMSAFDAPNNGCAFAERCAHAQDRCRAEQPTLAPHGAGESRCWRTNELAPLHATAFEATALHSTPSDGDAP